MTNFRETYTDTTRADAFDAILADLDAGTVDAFDLTDSDVALIVDGIWGDLREPIPTICFESDARRVLGMIRATFALLGDIVGFCALLLILGGALMMLGALSPECFNCGAL